MRWVAIGVVVVVVLLLAVRLLGTARRPRPDEDVGRSMRVRLPPPEAPLDTPDPRDPRDPRDRSRDE